MSVFSAVLPLVFIIILFFLIVRIATVMLKLTGLDEQTARFQAISAFTGTGFTTREAETILADPMRRKIAVVLMIMGKIGVVSVIAGVFLSFGKDNLRSDLWKAFALLGFILILYKFTTLDWFGYKLNRAIERKVIARAVIKQKTLEELFRLPEGYGIAQLTITGKNEEKGQSLSSAGFINKDILVLSIERGDKLIAFPKAEDRIQDGDKLLCYGFLKNMKTYV